MKVLMFGWEFPPYISGGLGTACHGLTKGLTQLGTEVVFVLPRIRGPIGESHVTLLPANRVPAPPGWEQTSYSTFTERLRVLAIDSALSPYLNETTYLQWMEQQAKTQTDAYEHAVSPGLIELSGDYGHDLLGEVARYATVGARLGVLETFDLIHAHDWMTYPAAMEAKRVSGRPMIAHVHATEFDRSGEHVNQGVYDIERVGMHAADRVITVSERTRQMVIERYGVDPNKVFVVHNAVEKDKTVERHDIQRALPEKIVLFLGRITMQKGPDYFVEAAHRVLQKYRNVRFVMAGAGDMLPRMIERAATLRITDRFHFTGFLKGVEVDRMFAMSDLYVLPSVSEPFGITPFEALKHDVPVILSKQAGVGELLPNATKVDFWDIKKLSDAIIGVLVKKDETIEGLGRDRRDLESVSWERSAQRTMALYQEALKP